MGSFRPGSPAVWAMECLNRAILRKAERVVALDEFMAGRLAAKQPCDGRLVVIPPWPLETGLAPVPHAENPFRREHGLAGKFVVMYSGNMSPAHPLETILQAAALLADRRDLVFLFIGGGLGRRQRRRTHRPQPRRQRAAVGLSTAGAAAILARGRGRARR